MFHLDYDFSLESLEISSVYPVSGYVGCNCNISPTNAFIVQRLHFPSYSSLQATVVSPITLD